LFVSSREAPRLRATRDTVVTALPDHALQPGLARARERARVEAAREWVPISLRDVALHPAQRERRRDRGTGRKLLPDDTPDAILSTLDEVPALFESIGW